MAKHRAESQEIAGNGINEEFLPTKNPAAGSAPQPNSPPRKKQACTDIRTGGFRVYFKRTEQGWTAKVLLSRPAMEDLITRDKKAPKVTKPRPNTGRNTNPKPQRKGKSKRDNVDTEAPPAPPPKPRMTRASRAFEAKIEKILDFVSTRTYTNTALTMANSTLETVSVPESALLGVLMCMRADYEIGDPATTTIDEVKDAIVREQKRPIGTGTAPITHYTVEIGLCQKTKFEKKIWKKLKDYGLEEGNLLPSAQLEEVNLMAFELEMYMKQLEAAAANELLHQIEDTQTETDVEIYEGSAIAETETLTKAAEDQTAARNDGGD